MLVTRCSCVCGWIRYYGQYSLYTGNYLSVNGSDTLYCNYLAVRCIDHACLNVDFAKKNLSELLTPTYLSLTYADYQSPRDMYSQCIRTQTRVTRKVLSVIKWWPPFTVNPLNTSNVVVLWATIMIDRI